MTALSKGQSEALRCLRIFTNGNYAVAKLAGSHNATKRRAIFVALQERHVPLAKCGVNAVREAFYLLAGIDTASMTYRAAELAFDTWAHAHGDHLDIKE